MKKILWTLALLSAGCAKQVTLGVNLVTAACVDATALPAGEKAVPGPTDDVETLRFLVTVSGDAGAPIDVPLAQDKVSLPVIGFGQTARVDVFGLGAAAGTAAAPLLSFGTSADFDIPSNTSQSTVDVTVVLRRVDAFSEEPVDGGATCATLTHARAYHAQTLLSDGRVLLYGGLQYPTTVDWTKVFGMPPQPMAGTSYLDDAEIFDPATGSFTPAGSLNDPSGLVPGTRAFADLIASQAVVGGATLVGGETLSDAGLAGANAGAVFGPPSSWEAEPFVAIHGHGCTAQDTLGHSMVAAGLNAAQVASPAGEFIDSTVYPPIDRLSTPVLASQGLNEARVDQVCAGFLDVLGNNGPSVISQLVMEAGGYTTDTTGQNASLLGDLFFYSYSASGAGGGKGTFVPFAIPGSTTLAVSPLVTGPRVRARAAAFSLTDALTGDLSDAVLIAGGLTCDTTPDAGCLPTFVDGGTSGQLGKPITSYLPIAMDSTEVLAFPATASDAGISDDITTVVGPSLPTPRVDLCAVTLQNQQVLLLGGLGYDSVGNFGTLNDARYTVPPPTVSPLEKVQIPTLTAAGFPLRYARAGMACTLLNDGSVLVTGGYQTTGALSATSTQTVKMLNTAEIYTPLPKSITAPAGP